MSKDRKGKIITILGEDIKKRIPRVFDVIYKIETTPVTDEEDVEKDETFKLHTLRTVDVEGVTIVDGGKAVNVNGDFDISLEKSDDDESENELREKVFADKDEAIAAWRYLSNLQLDKAKAMREKIENTVHMLETSIEERQY